MLKEFTYQIPDDLFVEGVSGKKVATYTYDGPEKISVILGSDGSIIEIEPKEVAEPNLKFLIEVDADKNPEIASFFLNDILESGIDHKYEFDEEIMENGDVYKFPKNPLLTDVYYPIYNFELKSWEIKQHLREKTKIGMDLAKKRIEYITAYTQKYSFPGELETIISDYLNSLNNYIENCPEIMIWKYINIPKENVPKIPYQIAAEFNKLPPENIN